MDWLRQHPPSLDDYSVLKSPAWKAENLFLSVGAPTASLFLWHLLHHAVGIACIPPTWADLLLNCVPVGAGALGMLPGIRRDDPEAGGEGR